MELAEQIALWLTILGSLAALGALAWSAVNYVMIRKLEIKHSEYQKFFEITDHLGAQGHSIASKMAAAYELRKYPQYRDVVIRLAENVGISGDPKSTNMLKEELLMTAEFLGGSERVVSPVASSSHDKAVK
jgi:hypothetical protein